MSDGLMAEPSADRIVPFAAALLDFSDQLLEIALCFEHIVAREPAPSPFDLASDLIQTASRPQLHKT